MYKLLVGLYPDIPYFDYSLVTVALQFYDNFAVLNNV